MRLLWTKNSKLKSAARILMGSGAIMLYEGIRVTNPLSLFVIMAFSLLILKAPRLEDKRGRVIATVVSFFLSVFCFLHGTQVLHDYDLGGTRKALALGILLIGLWIAFERLLELIYSLVIGADIYDADSEEKDYAAWNPFVVLLAIWLPFYLWNFPGSVTSDSTTQILQAINHSYSNHHPVLQTWMIQGVMSITSLFTDSLNVLVAICIALQCLFLAFVYAYTISSLQGLKVKKSIIVIILIYFAVMPYNIMMALNMWKDTLFSAGMLLMIVSLWRLLHRKSIIDLSLLFISGIIVCMFRNNGWYAFIATLPVAVFFFWKKGKEVCFVLGAVLIAVIVIRGPVFKLMKVEPPNVIESLAIPMQQVANVVSNRQDSLSAEDINLLSEVIDIDEVAVNYDIHCADSIKNLLIRKDNTDYIADHKVEFIKLWIRLGIKNPGFYLQAFVNQTEGYYYPDIQRWQYTEGVWDTQMPIRSVPLLPTTVCKVLRWYVSDWLYDIPVLGMLKSIGFAVWCMFVLLGYCILKKKYKLIVLFAPLVLYWGTLIIATPVYAEFRYIYCLFLTIPVLLFASVNNNLTKETEE